MLKRLRCRKCGNSGEYGSSGRVKWRDEFKGWQGGQKSCFDPQQGAMETRGMGS